MDMKIISFSSDWSKLQYRNFTTIRKRRMAVVNETVKIIDRETNKAFFAECLKIDKRKLKHIGTNLLLTDTDSKTREEAIGKIQSFYYKPVTDETIFFIHYFERYRNG